MQTQKANKMREGVRLAQPAELLCSSPQLAIVILDLATFLLGLHMRRHLLQLMQMLLHLEWVKLLLLLLSQHPVLLLHNLVALQMHLQLVLEPQVLVLRARIPLLAALNLRLLWVSGKARPRHIVVQSHPVSAPRTEIVLLGLRCSTTNAIFKCLTAVVRCPLSMVRLQVLIIETVLVHAHAVALPREEPRLRDAWDSIVRNPHVWAWLATQLRG
mmetsp:Transcript_62834/g.205127  ORF Transcript_62834/g.205127 Transcript_62834/m.205127 type:complete len:215 (+) Transcript_62834:684-1328(+)